MNDQRVTRVTQSSEMSRFQTKPWSGPWRETSKGRIYHGEFDPGSGRTLAACLIHASRTPGVGHQQSEASRKVLLHSKAGSGFWGLMSDIRSGGRVSNT